MLHRRLTSRQTSVKDFGQIGTVHNYLGFDIFLICCFLLELVWKGVCQQPFVISRFGLGQSNENPEIELLFKTSPEFVSTTSSQNTVRRREARSREREAEGGSV
jgi:hypothetical protein